MRELPRKNFIEAGIKLLTTPPSPEENSPVCISSPHFRIPTTNSGKAEQLWPAEDASQQHHTVLPSTPQRPLGSSIHPAEGELPQQSFAQSNPDGNDPSKGIKETFTAGIVKCSQGIERNVTEATGTDWRISQENTKNFSEFQQTAIAGKCYNFVQYQPVIFWLSLKSKNIA